MEKVKLNNQIVSMRKFVKQAKVHAINKLVKQIKLLQNRKGSETQVQKAKRKADRYLEAVALLKKIKPDDVSKLALSKAKNWEIILQQKNATLHDRCIAMLANYGAVQKEVKAFYDANKEFVLKITDYIAQWEEKNRSSKVLPKSSKMLPEKKLIMNVQEEKLENLSKKNKFKTKSEFNTPLKISQKDKKVYLEAENSSSNDDDDEIENLQQINNYANPNENIEKIKSLSSSNNSIETGESDGSDNKEMINISFMNNNKDDAKDSSDKESDNNNKNNDKEMIDIDFKNNNEEDVEDSSDEDTSKINKIMSKIDLQLKMDNNVKNKLKTIAFLNLNEFEELDEIPVGSSFGNDESDEEEANETSQDRNIDPFFLGNNEEISNAKEFDSFSRDNDACSRDFVSSFKSRSQNAKSFLPRRKDDFSHDKSFKKSSYVHKNASKNFKKDKFISTDYNNAFQERSRKDIRQKNKFFPTKDTYDKKKFKNTSRSYENKDNIAFKNKASYKKGNANESLHPSWEAKRKQKELLSTSFQGKRIIFDE